MRRNSQFLEAISIFLIFILLIHLSGCYSYKPISATEIAKLKNKNGIIHSNKSKYYVNDIEILNDTLYCKMDKSFFDSNEVIKIHIYLSRDSTFYINSNSKVSISLASIEKFHTQDMDFVKTVFLTLGIVAVGFMILLLIFQNPHNGDWTVGHI